MKVQCSNCQASWRIRGFSPVKKCPNCGRMVEVNEITYKYRQADKHLRNGEYREAIDLYGEVIQTAKAGKDEWCCFLSRGYAHMMMDEHDEAANDFDSALRLAPSDIMRTDHRLKYLYARAFCFRGKCFYEMGRFSEAMSTVERAYAICPSDEQISKTYREMIAISERRMF